MTEVDQRDATHPVEHEPDYRFTLANERTFLAWIRTTLGLLAGGVAVHQLIAPFHVAGARTVIAVGCVALAAVLATGAYFHWRTVQQAMRRDQPLPSPTLVPLLAASVGLIAVIAAISVLIG
ncbi:YidH family protein [Antrihabitans cavernicola]|uniref:DUF202 domain-containing protein n=1 Tax=Antrihabitans cavernicola TaxID=2495913 RepID=A0A5A7S2L8_9NOCA|nr:DUF202 domain-containing protein [Spelaeibacter cavernicola]KAA0018393.1 DUF202 domain-containing protein [Spelaeibacter cavernicola]